MTMAETSLLYLVLEDTTLPVEEIHRLQALCTSYFPDCHALLASSQPAASWLGLDVELWPAPEPKSAVKAVFRASSGGKAPTLAAMPAAFSGAIALGIDTAVPGRRYRVQASNAQPYSSHAPQHAFEALSVNTPKGYIYFPYGYQYRLSGHGPLDSFGHRISQDLSKLEARDPNNIVIATFGGSTTWSIDCLPHETWTAQLEALLNDAARKAGASQRFTCLNFGQAAYSVLSQMQSYLLHCLRLRPDIVLSHDGWNDLLYGSYTDPVLLRDHAIVYPCDLEPWAQHLHGTAHLESTKTRQIPYQFRSAPSQIIDAYVSRKAQFERIVKSDGGHFIWGLQPCIHDKAKLSEAEAFLTQKDNPLNQDNWRVVRKRVPELMRLTAAALDGAIEHNIDCSVHFGTLDAGHQHFTDTIHLTPEGDLEIARIYADYILKSVVKLEQN